MIGCSSLKRHLEETNAISLAQVAIHVYYTHKLRYTFITHTTYIFKIYVAVLWKICSELQSTFVLIYPAHNLLIYIFAFSLNQNIVLYIILKKYICKVRY